MNDRDNLKSSDPLELFGLWLQEAERSEPNDPNAAALATSTVEGVPSVRMAVSYTHLDVYKRQFPQCFAIACMLLKHSVKARNPHENGGEPLGKITSRDANNGILEHEMSPLRR